MENSMYYTIYKITNQIDGKFYIGSHKTKDLNDNYMGSGKYLKYAQQKYGIENFTKEILYVFETSEEMYAKEFDIVNEEFLASENTYNLKIGGFGGWDYNNTADGQKLRKHSYVKWRQSGTESFLHKFYTDENFAKNHIDHMRQICKIGTKSFMEKYPNGTFYGKKHSDESKKKIAKKNSIHQQGKNNSQFGTRWIHSTELRLSKKIGKTDSLPEGYSEGRKIKF